MTQEVGPTVVRIGICAAAAVVAIQIGTAASASADSAEFIRFLKANGEDESTQEIQFASIDLGNSICDFLDANQSPNATVDYLVSRGHTSSNANMWMAGSVLYLCPRLNYLTHYPTHG